MHALADTVEGAEDTFMKIADTWPNTRGNVFEAVREALEEKIGASRKLEYLSDVFANIKPIAAGSLSNMKVACIKKERSGTECLKVVIPGSDTDAHELHVSIKEFPEKQGAFEHFSGFHAESGWQNTWNPLREMLAARLLNHLVRSNITPHLPMVVETFAVEKPSPERCIATELCHMTFEDFMNEFVHEEAEPHRFSTEAVHVALLQILHGIAAAQKHLDLRHNDLTADNVMMTYIEDVPYCYVVHGETFHIPTLGMCWKIVDFASVTSDVLFGEGDTFDHFTNTKTLTEVAQKFRAVGGVYNFDDVSFASFDVLTFLADAYIRCAALEGAPRQKEFLDVLKAYMDGVQKVSDLPTFGVLRKTFEESQNISATTLAHMLSLRETLVADLFVAMAEKQGYEKAGYEDGAHACFDLDASPQFDNLSGIESEYYRGKKNGTLTPLVPVTSPKSPYVDVFDISELLAVGREVETGRLLPLAFSDIGLASSNAVEDMDHYLLETDLYANINGYRGQEFAKPVLFTLADLVFHPETNSPVIERRFLTALLYVHDHPEAFDLATKYNGFILADYVDMLGQKYGAHSEVTPALVDDVAIAIGNADAPRAPKEDTEDVDAIQWIEALRVFKTAHDADALRAALPKLWDRHCYVKQFFDVIEADLAQEQEAAALDVLEEAVEIHANCAPILLNLKDFVKHYKEITTSHEAFLKTVRHQYLLTLPLSVDAYVNWLKETGQEDKPEVGAHLIAANVDE